MIRYVLGFICVVVIFVVVSKLFFGGSEKE